MANNSIQQQNTAFPQSQIIVFAKAPVAGKVKTRFGVAAEKAAQIYQQLLFHTMEMASSSQLATIRLYWAGDRQHPVIAQLAEKYHFELCLQQGQNLGQRMANAIAETLQTAKAVVLIGSDCPSMQSKDLRAALQALQGADKKMVIQPAEDGGYVLIGMNSLNKDVFEQVEWSTNRVMAQTLAKVGNETRLTLLPVLADIDTWDDWLKFNAGANNQ